MTKLACIAIVTSAVLCGCGKKQDDKSPPPVPTTKEQGTPEGSGTGSATGGSAAQGSGSNAGSGSGSDAAQPATAAGMPKEGLAMTQDQARTIVADAIKVVAAGGDPPCDRIAPALEVAVPIAYPEPTKDAADALTTWGKCAAKAKRWRSVVKAGRYLLMVAPDPKTPAQIVRALAEMGEYDKALDTAKELAKKVPAAAPLITAAMTFTYCKAESWDQCVKSADTALAALAKEGVADTDTSVLANKLLRDLAWVVIGKPKDALADFDKLEQAKAGVTANMTAVKDAAQKAIDRGFYLEVVPISQLPVGVYHLMGRKDTGALVTFKLHEHAGKARTFRVEAEVAGVTERSSNTVELKGHEAIIRWVNPPLKMDFDPTKIQSPRPSQLAFKVVEVGKDGDKTIFDETLTIDVLPRNYLPLKRKVGADAEVMTLGYLGAWVMSNDKSLEEFLTKAKARVPTHGFEGEQQATVPQVKAIFDELKARGVSYVLDPDVTGDTAVIQRTRLPAEVLASTNAQCLEGTLLFASLLESVGIKPIIVLVPGHAFIGWHSSPKDGFKGGPVFVETTMVSWAPFEKAVEVAMKRVVKESDAGNFKSGAATFVDVSDIRKHGFTAQPM